MKGVTAERPSSLAQGRRDVSEATAAEAYTRARRMGRPASRCNVLFGCGPCWAPLLASAEEENLLNADLPRRINHVKNASVRDLLDRVDLEPEISAMAAVLCCQAGSEVKGWISLLLHPVAGPLWVHVHANSRTRIHNLAVRHRWREPADVAGDAWNGNESGDQEHDQNCHGHQAIDGGGRQQAKGTPLRLALPSLIRIHGRALVSEGTTLSRRTCD